MKDLKISVILLYLQLITTIGFSQSVINIKIDSIVSDTCYCIKKSYILYENGVYCDKLSSKNCYYFDGKIKDSYSLLKGYIIHGLFQSFYENGRIKVFCTYNYGAIIGPYFQYYDNGQIMCIGNYKYYDSIIDIKTVCDTTEYIGQKYETVQMVTCGVVSIPVGIWYFYNEYGDILYTLQYDENGSVIKQESKEGQ